MKKALLIDYGGTLDTDGVHWSEFFWNAYQHFHIPVTKKNFKDAFVYSERKIPAVIKPNYGLEKTYGTQLNYQFEYLEKENLLSGFAFAIINDMSRYCLNKVLTNIETTRSILSLLEREYKLGIISNYYGNLETVLVETSLKKYFDVIIDSTVAGIRKPDKKIFELALNKLGVEPKNTTIIGDSYKNDIVTAKELGCSTIWINVAGWDEPAEIYCADNIINSIKELNDLLIKK
jgi:putative hydrolase of the HAD superfamily